MRDQRPEAVIGAFHDWVGFGRLLEERVADVVQHGEGPDKTMDLAIQFMKKRKPTLLFVHCDHVDHAGHRFGWGSQEYNAAVTKADALVGKMLTALDEAGIAKATVLLITADHGGKGRHHGCMTMGCRKFHGFLQGRE